MPDNSLNQTSGGVAVGVVTANQKPSAGAENLQLLVALGDALKRLLPGSFSSASQDHRQKKSTQLYDELLPGQGDVLKGKVLQELKKMYATQAKRAGFSKKPILSTPKEIQALLQGKGLLEVWEKPHGSGKAYFIPGKAVNGKPEVEHSFVFYNPQTQSVGQETVLGNPNGSDLTTKLFADVLEESTKDNEDPCEADPIVIRYDDNDSGLYKDSFQKSEEELQDKYNYPQYLMSDGTRNTDRSNSGLLYTGEVPRSIEDLEPIILTKTDSGSTVAVKIGPCPEPGIKVSVLSYQRYSSVEFLSEIPGLVDLRRPEDQTDDNLTEIGTERKTLCVIGGFKPVKDHPGIKTSKLRVGDNSDTQFGAEQIGKISRDGYSGILFRELWHKNYLEDSWLFEKCKESPDFPNTYNLKLKPVYLCDGSDYKCDPKGGDFVGSPVIGTDIYNDPHYVSSDVRFTYAEDGSVSGFVFIGSPSKTPYFRPFRTDEYPAFQAAGITLNGMPFYKLGWFPYAVGAGVGVMVFASASLKLRNTCKKPSEKIAAPVDIEMGAEVPSTPEE